MSFLQHQTRIHMAGAFLDHIPLVIIDDMNAALTVAFLESKVTIALK